MRRSTIELILTLALAATSVGSAQSTQPTPIAATAATVVPTLVRYAGSAVTSDGKPRAGEAAITFLIYRDEKDGEPLWVETQTVAFDPAGRYDVHLGAMSASGLPADLFANGEARWLEVQIAGGVPAARVLLASVPYALNAATLGGLPASAFVLAGSQVAPPATLRGPLASSGGLMPDSSLTVTTSGGAANYLPVFTGSNTIGTSELYDTGTGVGVGGEPGSGAKLDVHGSMIMRGNMTVTRTGDATTLKAYPSYGFDFYSNVYNSSTKATDNPHFQLQSEPTGNNSSNTGATLNLLYSNHGTAPVETGLSINPSGVIKFATGQTFDLNSSSGVVVQGNSTSGTGVEGTSNTGSGIVGSTQATTQNVAGVLGLAGSTKSGFYLDEPAGVWGDASSTVGVFGTSKSDAGVLGDSDTSDGVFGGSNSGVGVSATSQSFYGVFAYTVAPTGNNVAGVYGLAGDMTTGSTGIAGVWGDSIDHVGVYGTSTNQDGVAGVSTNNTGVSGSSTYQAGVAGSSTISAGVTGTSATVDGVYGENDQSAYTVSGSGVSGTAIAYSYGVSGHSEKGNGALFQGGTDDHDQNGGDGVIAFGGSGNLTGDGIVAYPGDTGGNGGNFGGNIVVQGAVNGSEIQARIDHPTDPANKYLVQASVQSSERMNIYSGNVVTDDLGLATVTLPDWFESVNTDFRYQLTVLGQFAQAIIKNKVADKKFRIMTNASHVEVSWQITAVRQDAYAKAHPLVVEEAKPVAERGFYLHPELYGQPAEKQTEWARHPLTMRSLAAHHSKAGRITVPTLQRTAPQKAALLSMRPKINSAAH